MDGFKDLLVKRQKDIESGPTPALQSSEDDWEMLPPRLTINSRQLQEVEGWDVGKEYTLKVRMCSKDMTEKDSGKREVYGDFEVVSAKVNEEEYAD